MEERKALPQEAHAEVTERDLLDFKKLIRFNLSVEEEKLVANPEICYPKQKEILAVHWHPEQVSIPVVEQRIKAMFPGSTEELIIPTQHNQILQYGDYAGVEVDCYSPEFNQKVQLLLHFNPARLEKADVLKSMLNHTFIYRSSQLFDFLDCLTGKKGEFTINQAASKTGANEDLVIFTQKIASKLASMIDQNESSIPAEVIKNKLVRNFLDLQRPYYGDSWVDRAQVFVNQVKKGIKKEFDLSYFYKTQDFIEETRSLGGCIVIPHPEQFWPILLADYDIDGIEAWNPQSLRYTDFLISVVEKKNKTQSYKERPVLIFFGDDCHLGEKLKKKNAQSVAKANREIGYQPPWDDLHNKKLLITASCTRSQVITRYKNRLNQ